MRHFNQIFGQNSLLCLEEINLLTFDYTSKPDDNGIDVAFFKFSSILCIIPTVRVRVRASTPQNVRTVRTAHQNRVCGCSLL